MKYRTRFSTVYHSTDTVSTGFVMAYSAKGKQTVRHTNTLYGRSLLTTGASTLPELSKVSLNEHEELFRVSTVEFGDASTLGSYRSYQFSVVLG